MRRCGGSEHGSALRRDNSAAAVGFGRELLWLELLVRGVLLGGRSPVGPIARMGAQGLLVAQRGDVVGETIVIPV